MHNRRASALEQQPRILEESWSSFLQQQQQAEPVSGDPAAAEALQGKKEGEVPPDPFANIDLDELDEVQTKAIEAAKIQFATLQKEKAAIETTLEKAKGVASRYQSEADRARAELQKLQPRQEQQISAEEQAARELLIESGVKGEDLEKQVPFFTKMMQKSVAVAKQQIGADLGPMAGSVLNSSAEMAFNNARQTTQFLQDPAVAQEVWDKFVRPCIEQGQQVHPQAIADYAKIVWVDKGLYTQQQQPTNPQQPQPQPQPQVRQPNNGGFTFPGAQVLPPGNWQPPNAQNQQPVVSAEVNSAVTAVMSRLTSGTNIWPKGLSKPGRR